MRVIACSLLLAAACVDPAGPAADLDHPAEASGGAPGAWLVDVFELPTPVGQVRRDLAACFTDPIGAGDQLVLDLAAPELDGEACGELELLAGDVQRTVCGRAGSTVVLFRRPNATGLLVQQALHEGATCAVGWDVRFTDR